MQSTRTNQGGSVLAFIIVGTLLAIGVVGGVYLAHQRGEQQRVEQAAPVAVNDDNKKPETTSQPQPTGTSGGQTKTEESKKPSTSTPLTGSQPGTGTPSQTPATGQQSTPTSNNSQQSGTQPNIATGPSVNGAAALPVTGPIDSILQVIAVALLTAVTVAYVQSTKRQSPSSL